MVSAEPVLLAVITVIADFGYNVLLFFLQFITLVVNMFFATGFEDDGEQQGPHGFTCYEKDFCTEDDESKDKTLDGDVMEFDKLAQKMANVTSDGGVKKQVVVQGYGEIVPLESFVKSKIWICWSL